MALHLLLRTETFMFLHKYFHCIGIVKVIINPLKNNVTITYTKKQKVILFNLYNNKTIIYVIPKKLKITHDADEHTDAVKSIKTEFFMPSGNTLQKF